MVDVEHPDADPSPARSDHNYIIAGSAAVVTVIVAVVLWQVGVFDGDDGTITQTEEGADLVETTQPGGATTDSDDSDGASIDDQPAIGVARISEVQQWTVGRGLWTAEAAEDELWLPHLFGVTRLDLETGEPTRFEVEGHTETPLVAFGSVWVPNIRLTTLHRFDLADPDGEPVVIEVGERGFKPVAAGDHVWVANRDDETVSQIDPVDNSVLTIDVGGRVASMLGVGDELWLRTSERLLIFDTDGVFQELDAFTPAGSLFFAFDSVWVADAETGNLLRIDADTRTSTVAIDVGGGVGGLVASDRAIFLVTAAGVSRVNPDTNNVDALVPVDGSAIGLAADTDGVWITTRGPCSAVHFLNDASLALATFDVDGDPDTALVVGDRVFVSIIGDDARLIELTGAYGEVTPRSDQPAVGVAEALIAATEDSATLSGTVPSAAAAAALRSTAYALYGEENVSDELVVEADAAPFTVSLTGTLDTPERAVEVAAAFGMVCSSSVDNQLEPKLAAEN